MAVALDDETFADFDRARFRYTAGVIAPQIDQHQVFGAFLRIGQQFGFQRQILFLRAPAWPGAGDRSHRDFTFLQPHQDLRRGTDYLGRAGIEEVHVGRRIHAAQRTVHINRARMERNAQALAQHHLEGVAFADVVLAAVHGVDEALTGETADEIGFIQRLAVQRFRIRRAAVAQPVFERVQPARRLRPGLWLRGIGVHDQVQPALEAVEHRQLLGQHQQDVGRAQFVRQAAVAQARLDVFHAFEAEPADQPAGEAGQAVDLRHRVGQAQALDFRQRVFDLA